MQIVVIYIHEFCRYEKNAEKMQAKEAILYPPFTKIVIHLPFIKFPLFPACLNCCAMKHFGGMCVISWVLAY